MNAVPETDAATASEESEGEGEKSNESEQSESEALISTVNWMRYTVLKPGQSLAGFEDPSAILKEETWSHLGGKFKRS